MMSPLLLSTFLPNSQQTHSQILSPPINTQTALLPDEEEIVQVETNQSKLFKKLCHTERCTPNGDVHSHYLKTDFPVIPPEHSINQYLNTLVHLPLSLKPCTLFC